MTSFLFLTAVICFIISLVLVWLSFGDYRDFRTRKQNKKAEPGETPENPLIIYCHPGERKLVQTSARYIAICQLPPEQNHRPSTDNYEPQDRAKPSEAGHTAGARPTVTPESRLIPGKNMARDISKKYATTVKNVADETKAKDHMAERFDKWA